MPPRPGNRRSGGRIAAIVIACLLGVALIGGGAVFALSVVSDNSGGGDEPDVPSDALEVAWKSGLPRSTASSGSTVQWPARWLAGSTLVLGDENGVRAYDTGTGRQKWKVKPPEGAGEPCAMAPEASGNGVGAVLFDAGGDECSYLAAIDVDTGAVTWSKKLASEYGANVPQVYAGTKHITVGLNSTESIQMFDVRSGAPSDPLASARINCRYSYVFSAQHVVAKPDCRDELVVLDTQYGGRPTTVSKQQGKPLRILSDHPLTVAATVGEGDSSPPRVLNFAKDGESVRSVDLTGKAADVVFNDKDNGITESGLYFCKLRDGSVAALDLRSGRVLWEGKGGGSAFVGYDSAHRRMLIAEPDPEKSYWSRVGALDPDTGKLEPVGTMVLPDGTYLSGSRALYAYETGKVLAIGERADDGKRLVVAFEAQVPAP
ncbi:MULTISPECIES: outer membrane protein assembly factor BamB family protein [Streptomyces]|uniref:outer membrane protein assembly factor BamB family protein n=1 Tax=Streptomyces TaxID=1883 RepID=UPI00034E2F5E|nr:MULTISPECIES: PQQ-binding-like beta-propeller repeat protein [Streptomyces]EPD96934.1 hypothetical protein HMPREF1486_00544 [Streptomyces sp. HPH0547]QID35031.1 PQQ-binding-like beta-propeller repeat protein [Streptomyces albus]